MSQPNKRVKTLQILQSHKSDVITCDFGGNHALASGSGDKKIWVYDWHPGLGYIETPYSPLLGHKYGVTSVRFSPQGTMLATSSIDGTTALWNVQTGNRIHTFVQTNGVAVRVSRFAPDCSLLISAGDDGSVCVWSIRHKNLVRTFQPHEGTIQAVAFAPDSCYYITACSQGVMKLWEVTNEEETINSLISVDDVHDLGVTGCDFSPVQGLTESNEELFHRYNFATCGNDHLVKLWELLVGKKEKHHTKTPLQLKSVVSMEGHSSAVTCVRFSPSGSYIASAGIDKICCIWDLKGSCLSVLDGHLRYVTSCAFSRDGSLLASGSNDKTLAVWDLTGNLTVDSELTKPCSALRHYANNNTEHGLLDEEELMRQAERDKNEVKLLQSIDGHEGGINTCHFSGSKLLASGCGDNKIHVWTLNEDDQFVETSVSPLEGHQYSVYKVNFSPRGDKLASCSLDGAVIIWNIETGMPICPNLHCSGSGIRTCRFSPDGHLLVIAGDAEKACVWNIDSMECLMSCEGHSDAIVDAAFSPDSQFLVTVCSDGNFKLWCVAPCLDQCLITQEAAHDLGVQCCDFSPSEGIAGREYGPYNYRYLLATCGVDSLIKLWHITINAYEKTEECNLWKQFAGHGGVITCVCFAPPAGEVLGSTASDKTARLWNVYTGECLHVLENHNSMVTTCAFSTDANLFATGSLDRRLIVWQLPQGLVMQSYVTESFITERICKQKKKLLNWGVEDVQEWLRELRFVDVVEQVAANCLTGQQLVTLPSEEILDLLEISEEGERQKLRSYLFWLKKADYGVLDVPVDKEIPHEFLCPITHEIMQDPVICSDGFTYECAAINEWFLSGKFTSPMTNSQLSNTKCIPNTDLKAEICQFLYGETAS
ncbi:WD repeat, SAM and U-box domain-containing protein 1-like [Schistocerca piceifrons]|uniref:WD repeat, SAM and U-box domain-containing protein 1-like n=1 Tax=Schistocerca piceifrons TaxID=274613 RepID=UPI001F5F2391|nr:WD repeat, SAM and U-box domain-containing protein 1-like [Schistocerca piceifrons]